MSTPSTNTLQKQVARLKARNEKLERDVKKYKKQSLLMRDKINDLEYFIRDTNDEKILKDLRELKRHCPTKSETMTEIESYEGKVILPPNPDEPEYITQTYFCIKEGKEVTKRVKNPRAVDRAFNIRKKVCE